MADTSMDPIVSELNELFAAPSTELTTTVLGELQSILRIYSINPEDLSFKWESYCMKMGPEETKLDLKTVRDFKKDLQENLERESRGKSHAKANEKKPVGATPRAAVSTEDVFGMLDGIIPNTPRAVNGSSATKRKSTYQTPLAKVSKGNLNSSPNDLRTPDASGTPAVDFTERKDAGAVQETLNLDIELPGAAENLPTEPRFKLKANTEIAKFSYKTMAMKLSETSEILDDRIDEFMSLVQDHHKLDSSAFGNPASQSPNEIIAVGRIASDSSEGKLNAASLVLETSRRVGAGLRVPLKVDQLQSYEFFPGKIVALRGSNASGDFFSVSEVLDIPRLFGVASSIEAIDVINDRISHEHGSTTRPLTTLVASGPYTTDDSLDFSPFQALLSTAQGLQADALILCGPFIDAEHPLVRDGDFDLPPNFPASPDRATLSDLFQAHIARPLSLLAQALPSISIVLCPSVRDVIAKHAAWPQDRLPRKELGLPRQASVVPNPMMLSLNEIMFGMSSQDVLDQLRGSEVVGGKMRQANLLERLCQQILEQRHFFPMYPPADRKPLGHVADDAMSMGAMLDISYLKLGEWLNVKPDVLITSSVLPPFAKVVESVLVINPGTLSKKRGPGTFARMTILPLQITDEDREKDQMVGHRLYERCRVDIVKI